jgi:hypothetical protein
VLFDLRSSGRRRTVKVVYITLAFLMGGGLIFFGIGGGTALNGGLFDAFNGNNNGGGSVDDRFKKQEAALADLARIRYQIASQGDNYNPNTNTYTDAGKAQLRRATSAWERHLALAGDNPDAQTARSMVEAYIALNDTTKAVQAQEIVAADRNSPGAYSTLAQLAWAAGQTRKGDLARDKALALTPKDQRQTLKGQLDQAKQQAAGTSASGSG